MFFLSGNTTARLVAVEPDVENLEIAAELLRVFRDRCELVHGALWSHNCTLAVSHGTFADGRHWATQTSADVKCSSETVRAFTVVELLAQHDICQLNLLKIDIEGAELQVFRDGNTSFLERTRCCAIECHGPECVAAFEGALSPCGFSMSERGELIIAEFEITVTLDERMAFL